MKRENIHFVGIAGSGMSALAQIHAMSAGVATGSDRLFDKGGNPVLKEKLQSLGIKIFPQDAGGINKDTSLVVLSTAIEDSNPEIAAAKKLRIPIMHRSQLLAKHVEQFKTTAIAGTSGKSTVAAMIFEILERAGRSPSIITGGNLMVLKERGCFGNAFKGKSDILVIEADESDGSIVNYKPAVGVLLNLTRDHKDVPETKDIFRRFSRNVKTLLVNSDDSNLSDFTKESLTFGISSGETRACDIKLEPSGSRFTMNDEKFFLPIPGRHNVENAVAAVAVCLHLGIPLKNCAQALSEYKGVARRFQSLGKANGVEVIDDFAHNPAKVSCALSTARLGSKRVLAVYQPHGFHSTRRLKDELIEAFSLGLGENDMLWLPEIYYAGGTAERNISSRDITEALSGNGKSAFFIAEREKIIPEILKTARPGDLVIVMGARDPSLSDFAKAIFNGINGK